MGMSIACADCGLIMETASGACPECGSRNRHVLVREQIAILEGARLKKRTNREKRPHEEIRDEIRWSGDRGRLERRFMIIDREGGYYRQEWSDLKTGEVTFTKSGRLSDPDIHGESARRSAASLRPGEGLYDRRQD